VDLDRGDRIRGLEDRAHGSARRARGVMTAGNPSPDADKQSAVYLVVGSPVAHSLSPAMMGAAFARAGIEATYRRLEIDPGHWPAAMGELLERGVAGLNVTVPLKEGALVGAAEASDEAREIGAANTLLRREDCWRAENTDGTGFLDRLRETGSEEAVSQGALVLGAGGSARAIVWALQRAGCPRIRIAARRLEAAEQLARHFEPGVEAELPGGTAPEGGIVVNCTPLGMSPGDPLPIGRARLRGAGAVFDLVYPDTPLVWEAHSEGIPAEHGLGLLVAQGARSFRLWTGIDPDQGAMREAVRDELARRAFPSR
jgi:shikimate dehydrogenase